MSELETASFESGYRQLEQVLANGTASPLTIRKTLPLNKIQLMSSVFQPRSIEDMSKSDEHIRTLMDAAMNESGNVLDPMTVWWSGKEWLVLDGHHRFEAYLRLQAKGKGSSDIPVRVFQGSLKQAVVESTRANAKDKLPMTKDDKATRAWQLVVIGHDFSKREISKVCKVGTSTIGRMRARLEELKELFPESWSQEIEGLSWKEVINLDKTRGDFDDEWMERQAVEWGRRLTKTFGIKPASQVETFIRALEIYSPHLTTQMEEYFNRDNDNDDF
jgi:ParB-like chromosome segregation protein Spo0J